MHSLMPDPKKDRQYSRTHGTIREMDAERPGGLGTASDREYRVEITTGVRKDHVPTSGRLQYARILADRFKRMCEADLECRRLAPAWKLVTTVLIDALSFDCCVVPPEALHRLWMLCCPMFVSQDRLEHVSIKRIAFAQNAGGSDITPTLLRSPMPFLAQFPGDCPQCGQIERSASDGDLGTRGSSQRCAREAEMHWPVHGRKSDAARGGLSEARTGPCQRENSPAEEETVELETTAGRGGDTV